MSSHEVKEMIAKLAKKGRTPSQIGKNNLLQVEIWFCTHNFTQHNSQFYRTL